MSSELTRVKWKVYGDLLKFDKVFLKTTDEAVTHSALGQLKVIHKIEMS